MSISRVEEYLVDAKRTAEKMDVSVEAVIAAWRLFEYHDQQKRIRGSLSNIEDQLSALVDAVKK